MKKLFFAIAAFAVMSFAACGNQTQAGSVNDTDSVVVDSMFFDSIAVDTVVAE